MDNRLSRKMFRYISTVFVFGLIILLTSCASHVRKKDGPPNYYVDETRVPNAVPKPEPLAKYGNLRSYRVFGKRYFTLRSSKHYEAIGIASWYGTLFHKRRTSSGEPYNMLAMTAAHKTLPLPTYVEVTNLQNHRKIIVKVNDRGPFESNRLIDLSYVAAKKLGMLGHGTARVKVKALDPYHLGDKHLFLASRHTKSKRHLAKLSAPSELNTWQPTSPTNLVYLQVGAFRNKNHAEKLKQRLIGVLETPVNVSLPSAKSELYRVQVGPIQDVASADKITHQLKMLGIKSNKVH